MNKFTKPIKSLLDCCSIAIIVIASSILFLVVYFTFNNEVYTGNPVYHKYFIYRSAIVVLFAVFVSFGGILSTVARIKRLRKEKQFEEEYFIETMLTKVASKETLEAKVKESLDGIVYYLNITKAVMLIGQDLENLRVIYNKNFGSEEMKSLQYTIILGDKGFDLLRKKYALAFHFQIYGIQMYIFLDREKKLSRGELTYLKKYAHAMQPLFANALLFDLIVKFMVELQKVGTIYNVYWKMLDMAVRVFNADSGAVLDISKGKGNWSYAAVKNVSGRDVDVIEETMNKGDYNGPVLDIVKNKKVLYINDTTKYKGWIYTANMPRSYIGIPFVVGDKVVAIMNIHGDEPNKFTVYDVNLAKAIMEMGSAILERVLYLEQLGVYSSIDEMTALFNKREFMQRVKEEVNRAQRYGRKLSILIFDLDNFKEWNDTFGHLAGDNLLRGIGEIIKNSIRSTDLAFRFGGDEFIVLFPETSIDGASLTAQKILENISKHFGSEKVKLSASAGIAEYKPGETPEELINRADRALYAAKNSGKNQIYIAS